MAKKKTTKNVVLGNALMQNMREIISKDSGLGKESSYIPSYSTGLKVLDYRNGRMEDGEIYAGLSGGKISYWVGNSGTGKAQPLHSKIYTPTGYTEMGDILEGDKVLTPDGGTAIVTGIFEQGVIDNYLVEMNDGSTMECNDEHIFKVIYTENGKEFYENKTLNEIMVDYVQSNGVLKYSIPNVKPVGFTNDIEFDFTEISLEYSAIPPIYKYLNSEKRTVVLNHTLNKNTTIIEESSVQTVASTKSLHLAKDIVLLARSLGFVAYYKTLDASRGHIIFIDKETKVRYIKNITKIGAEPMRCIMIDSDEHLYVTDNFIATHNTTIVIQAACAMADSHELGSIFHFDCERSSTRSRIRNITGWTKEKFLNKYMHLDKKVTSESFFKLVKGIAKQKIENSSMYEYDSGKVDDFGNPIMVLPVTVVIVDSLATLVPDNVEEREELGGQMDATSAAKKNTAIFKGIMDSLITANIHIMVINHITEKVDTNAFAKKQAQINFLKQDETLPGGRAPIYLSDTLIKLISSTKLDPTKDFGIKGFMVKAELIKSRSNAAGNMVTLVFNQEKGFSDVLSSYQLLKERKKISGAGKGYYIPTMPEVKFAQKQLVEKYETIPEFRKAFDDYVEIELMDFLTKTEDAESEYNEDVSEDEITEDELEYDADEELWYHAETEEWYDQNEDGTFKLLSSDEE